MYSDHENNGGKAEMTPTWQSQYIDPGLDRRENIESNSIMN